MEDKPRQMVSLKAHHDSSDESDESESRYKIKRDSWKSIMQSEEADARSRLFFPHVLEESNAMSSQEHARQHTESHISWTNNSSLSSSIDKFRFEFDDMRHKMQIFGESLNLCKCIGVDFDAKVTQLENRLKRLEKRQKLETNRSESNYSYIINKNKKLSSRCLNEAKKLQMCGTEEEMREVAGRICRNYLNGAWKTVDATELNFRRISGGLSNFLYYVALPDDLSKAKLRETTSMSVEDSYIGSSAILGKGFTAEEPKMVLLRIYGQVHGERAMDAIVTESVIFTLLSERRLGPKLHGVFSGGRIEEYIPARPLLTKELSEPALSMKIAEKMAAIHSLDIPLSKEPNWLWKTMGKWIKTVKEERLAGNVDGKSENDIIKRLKNVDFDKEVEWLKKFLATVDSPVVFCHNDMQEGNILMLEDTLHNDDEITAYRMPSYHDESPRKSYDMSQDEENTVDSECSHISDSGEPKLFFIDFEYCAYNHRGFDIANHFQEWVYDYTNPAHPNYYDYQEQSPTLEQKEIFIREYLKHYNCNTHDSKDVGPSIDDVNHLLNEVDAFALASHLFWCLWSIVNASKSQIPFGYWEYAVSRLDTYLRLKQEVVKKDKFGPQKRKICEVDI